MPFSVRPVVHDIMKGGPLPYEGDEENLPVSEVNRGSPVSKVRRIEERSDGWAEHLERSDS